MLAKVTQASINAKHRVVVKKELIGSRVFQESMSIIVQSTIKKWLIYTIKW